MNALEALQAKPRAERTPIEQCIVDAATLEEAERDGETEVMEQAANDLRMTGAQFTAVVTVNDELHERLAEADALLYKLSENPSGGLTQWAQDEIQAYWNRYKSKYN